MPNVSVSTHDLGIRMWELAMNDERYSRALRAALKHREFETRDDLAQAYWIMGAIFSLNVLSGMEFKPGGKMNLKTYQIIETGEIVISGPEIFVTLPRVDSQENGD